MVAVVSGSGLGLFGSSASVLGGVGAAGNATVGRGGDRVYVNSASGNLIVQSQDEVLRALGLDLALVRTYNSQGLLNDDNGDNWRLGVHQRVQGLTGTLNTAGSTVTKVFGDGREVLYNYVAARARYESTEGEGAHDTLTNSGGTWTWTDGSGRNTETYNNAGQLTQSRDADGNAVTYTYSGALLTQITDASGQTTYLDYSGNNLTQIRVVSDGQTQTLTRYGYDADSRLASVTVDLTPADNAVSDNVTYTTTYTYDGTSRRIASITQQDGSSVAFTYELIDGEYRVRTATDAEGRVTTLTYSTPASNSSSTVTTVPADPDALTVPGEQTVTTHHPLNAAAVSTTETQTITTTVDLDEAALSSAPSGWSGAATRPTPSSTVNDPKIGFDASGNGIAIWRSDGNLYAQRFDRASGLWGAQGVLDERTNTTYAPSLSVDAAGNALATWVQSDGVANSVYASRFDAVSGTWSAATLLESSALAVATTSGTLVSALSGTNAAVAWLQTDGTRNNVYVSVLSGGVWGAATLVETSDVAAAQPSIAIDDLGNVTVLWQQSNGVAASIYSARYSAGVWGAATLLESSNTATNDPKIGFDANGNGLAIWREGGNLFARRYTRGSDSWSAQVALDSRTNTTYAPSLSIDGATGNAIAAWVQSDGVANSVYASRFDAVSGTWGAATLLESASLAVSTTGGTLVTAMQGNRAAVAWLQTDGTRNNLYVNRFDGAAWSGAALVESNDNAAAQPSLAIDADGNTTVLWQQSDGDHLNIVAVRYDSNTASWSGAAIRPTPSPTVSDPKVGFDAAGNGVALWRSAGNLYAQRFDRASGLWGAQGVLDERTNTTYAPSLSVDAAGNAIAAWVQSDGVANSVYASRLDAVSGTWSAATLLESASLAVATTSGTLVSALSGTNAAVAWLQTDGTRNNVYVSVLSGGVWGAATLVETSDVAAAQPSIAIDDLGNVTVLWQQSNGVAASIYSARYSAGVWGAATLLESSNTATNDPKIGFDANGNGLAIWREGGNLFARRYTRGSDSWSAQVALDSRTNTTYAPSLSIDGATGHAIAAWVQSDGVANSVYASRFDAVSGTWSAATLLENATLAVSTTSGTLVTAMQGNRAAVAWLQTDGTRNNLTVNRFDGAAWSGAALLRWSTRTTTRRRNRALRSTRKATPRSCGSSPMGITPRSLSIAMRVAGASCITPCNRAIRGLRSPLRSMAMPTRWPYCSPPSAIRR